MANFDGIIPELAKAGFIKKVNDLRSQISTLQQEIDTISESTKTMFWSNSIPSDLGTVGELQSFSAQVKAYSLIDVPPTYSVIAGSLPSGLTLNPVNGYITGVVGNYETITPCTFAVQAADNQTTITKQFTITVNAVNDAPTWITANELGDMTVDFISIQLSVNDPDSTPAFTIVDGSLPSGVTLSSSGLISGANPRDNLTYTFTVEANDGVNQVQRQFTFVAFNETPVWVTDGDLGTITGSSFSKSLSATDNDSTLLTYSVNPLSTLPVGVNLSNNGVLSGLNPLTNTSHTFDIDVSDGVNVITRTFFFYAYSEAPVWVSNASLGSFDTPTISIQLTATDAENEPLTYAVVAGSLPTGLTLTSSGLISGNNPFDGLTSSFTISVSDKANSVNREFSITCEVAAGEAIYTSVGNYSFTVPVGVREIDALVVAGDTGFTSVGDVKATKGGSTFKTIGVPLYGEPVLGAFVFKNYHYFYSRKHLVRNDGNGEYKQIVLPFDSKTYNITCISANDDYFVLKSFSLSTKIWKCTDGVNFVQYTTTSFDPDVMFSDGLTGVMACTSSSTTVWYTEDGVNWLSRLNALPAGTTVRGGCFFKGSFYICCYKSTNTHHILMSNDKGVSFTEVYSSLNTTGNSTSIDCCDNYIVSAGSFGSPATYYMIASTDGVNWTTIKSSTSQGLVGSSCRVANNRLFLINSNPALYSDDLVTFNTYSYSTTGNHVFFNNKYISVGSLSPAIRYYDPNMLNIVDNYGISFDGNAITKVVSNQDGSVLLGVFDDITYPNSSSYVTDNSSKNYVYRSSDGGVSWTKTTPFQIGLTGLIMRFVNGMFVVTYGNKIYSSVDGVSWSSYTDKLSNVGFYYSGGYYYFIPRYNSSNLAYGYKKSTLSDNKIQYSYTGVFPNNGFDNSIEFNGSVYATYLYYIYKTSDFVNWSLVYSSALGQKTCAMTVFQNKLYVFYDAGQLVSSSDGTNWTSNVISAFGGKPVMSTCSLSGRMLCCGQSSTGYGVVFSTTDGISFSVVDVGYRYGKVYTALFNNQNSTEDFLTFGEFGSATSVTYQQPITTNTDATLTRPSTEGFSLTNPNNNGNYGKLSGIAGYKNNIPVNPSDTINVSVPSLDGAVRIIWGGSRDFPDNAV